MSRVPWKEGKVVSVETRPGLFALGQMLIAPYMVFFDDFYDSPDWPERSLDKLPILHVVGTVRQFINSSNVKPQKHLRPTATDYPKRWIEPNSEPVFRTVWTGTPHEMTVGYIGSKASLVEQDITAEGFDDSLDSECVIKRSIKPNDSATIDRYELNTLEAHPYQNERLYLCHLLGRNVDVIKDLIFRRDLPIEYETFLRYIALTDDQIADLKPGSIEVDPRMPGKQRPYSELDQRKKT